METRIDRRWGEVANRETGEITSQMQSEQCLRFAQPANETLQALTTITPEQSVTVEDAGGHVLDARDEKSDANVPPHHGVPTVQTI